MDELKRVFLWDFHPIDKLTAKSVAMLAYRLAAHRLQVEFIFDEEVVS